MLSVSAIITYKLVLPPYVTLLQ